ncbi:sulfurtransferase-like selenium metabolism protein YedF [Campylobacter sp. VicNov18]|uniref:sulfurtransferase-like selenium metabolism protein YedF n=1 Tax=Campylobacter bilis TaxID=2691918 RepID=UPI00130DE5AC|nr:sulfurtransferase-like selenium metabolism protein YedF [Campylobacter bilis]MPV63943.1 sulfurtransferase-like selenium metabolism protein YedF [Campylobacter hepaticus]MBM0637444.1 sulfurtransferase-like selenium metabolism protein YedF [Campylobacter bilis]MCC8278163.1 sulfurtransferase-like selenium metabolism protein YedF [Campylobacter bilis]MCC8299667.1 sulfurtransferase-like selenium metabolism protein YedF [Campylobacter bilis]MCC8301072.1 sulfurtransferase-like selenium metabolism 
MKITYSLNLQGEACPYPAIATLDALTQLKSKEILEVLCDCPQSINSIPEDAKNRGFKILQIDQDGPILRFLIQKH